jgi:hypothetical protein
MRFTVTAQSYSKVTLTWDAVLYAMFFRTGSQKHRTQATLTQDAVLYAMLFVEGSVKASHRSAKASYTSREDLKSIALSFFMCADVLNMLKKSARGRPTFWQQNRVTIGPTAPKKLCFQSDSSFVRSYSTADSKRGFCGIGLKL